MAKTLQPGDIVPLRALQPLDGGPPVRIGANRLRAQVLVVTHQEPCDRCAGYLDSLGSLADAMRNEKAELLALVGGGWEPRRSAPVPGAVADAAIVQALSPEGGPVVTVADRFGQLFTRAQAGDDHSFPDEDWIRSAVLDIAIRCPECGVPDVPSPTMLPEEGTRSGGMVLGQ